MDGREWSFVLYKGLGHWFSKWGPGTSISVIWECARNTIRGPTLDPLNETVWEKGQVMWLNGGRGLSGFIPLYR